MDKQVKYSLFTLTQAYSDRNQIENIKIYAFIFHIYFDPRQDLLFAFTQHNTTNIHQIKYL